MRLREYSLQIQVMHKKPDQIRPNPSGTRVWSDIAFSVFCDAVFKQHESIATFTSPTIPQADQINLRRLFIAHLMLSMNHALP